MKTGNGNGRGGRSWLTVKYILVATALFYVTRIILDRFLTRPEEVKFNTNTFGKKLGIRKT